MTTDIPLFVLLVGATVVLALLAKSGLERKGVPSLIGYLLVGFLLRLAGLQWEFLSPKVRELYEFLASIGIICLLFDAGLKSNLTGLVRQLRNASLIWIVNVLFSGVLGYITSHFLLGLQLVPSLFIAVALTATSVGVSVSVWQESGALTTATGELVVDVAELDDLSGIILMALLFTAAPLLRENRSVGLFLLLGRTSALLLIKLALFAAFCFFFSRFLERPLTDFFKKKERPPDPMVMIVGAGLLIASVAGLIGFSVAIGAFFAGLVFSRDPQAVRMEGSFLPLYEFFTPFFFVGIGLNLEPQALTTAFGLGVVLLGIAILGKIVGNSGPALITLGWQSSLIVGISMVPRAEIAMIIIGRGYRLGEWAVPSPVFGAMVFISAVTCLVSPLALRSLLRHWPQQER
jgi:Kef-type K+ transport system membrane component KefB